MTETESKPESKPKDFSRPLEMLKAGQACLRAKCETLRELVGYVVEHGCDEHVRKTAADLIGYFDTAAHCHHEDVEQDLLPRMVAAATIGRGSSLSRLVADVTNEHRAMQRAWIYIRSDLHEMMAGQSATLDALAVDHFVKLYQSHIAVADANVFPLAEMLLSNDDLAAIGAHMAQRRGVYLP